VNERRLERKSEKQRKTRTKQKKRKEKNSATEVIKLDGK
jgi:hypothetical protein